MSEIHEFQDCAEDWSRITALHPWDLLIHGGGPALSNEHRCRRTPEIFSGAPHLRIARHHPERRDYLIVDSGEGRSDAHFSDLDRAIAKTLRQTCRNVVIDITSVEVDVLMLLMSILAQHPATNLSALFLSPAAYQGDGSRLKRWSKPKQPSGYVTLRPFLADEPRCEHWVLLGFDEGRASRVIGEYDWDYARIFSMLGDPPYVAQGERRALDANKHWLDDIPERNRHQAGASDPFAVKRLLRARLEGGAVLDILPFGPRPMVLGALLFYFSLAEPQRERVRFLYDFPEYCTDNTTGVGRCFLYDFTGFAAQ